MSTPLSPVSSTSISPVKYLPPTPVLRKLSSDPDDTGFRFGGKEDEEEKEIFRKRCYSESLHAKRIFQRKNSDEKSASMRRPPKHQQQQTCQQRRSVSPRLFRLDESIVKSTEQLGRISHELEALNADLTKQESHFIMELSGGEEEDLSFKSLDDEINLNEACRCAQEDLRLAYLAKAEFRCILDELEAAWLCEGKDMAARACCLRRESESVFEKMSPEALDKLKLGTSL